MHLVFNKNVRERTVFIRLKHEQMKQMFPINEKNSQIQTRHKEMYKVNKANTERYRQSAVPYLQRLLNEEEQVKFNEKKRYI